MIGTTKRLIKIKFSMKTCKPCQLKEHCTKAPRRAISVRVKEHHQALQEARARQKGAEFREKYRSRSGIEGTISKAGSRLWSPSQSLSRHGENTFAAPGVCNRDQSSANACMDRRDASCQNAHVEIRCFSFGCLSREVRHQYQSAEEPYMWVKSHQGLLRCCWPISQKKQEFRKK